MATYLSSPLNLVLVLISTAILRDHRVHENLRNKGPGPSDSPYYDYIVVGGGTAGCVLAARLSENRNLRVLLLEEGDTVNVATDIVAMDALNLFQQPNLTKQFLLTPQEAAAQGFPNHQFNIFTGRVLGGGSLVNGMFYNRGSAADYDGWERDYGAEGWSFEDVLPFFKKLEDQTDPAFLTDTRYHGVGGPMTIISPNLSEATATYRLLTETIIDAAAENGYPLTNINGANQVGTTRIQRTMRDGKRLGTASAYLQPVLNRTNLFIVTGARVTKLNFWGQQAVGVEYDHEGRSTQAMVTDGGEIILSAGTIDSAKLLLLSGVGPRADLHSLNIPLVADLPVGHNLQDHCRSGGVDFVVNRTVFTFWEELLTVENLSQLYGNASGPLASQFYLHQAAGINFVSSVPAMNRLFGPSDVLVAPALAPSGLIFLTGGPPFLNNEILTKYYGPYFGQNTINMYSSLNYVMSRGQVKLRSTDPYDPPLVDPRFLTEREDVDRLIDAYKFTLNLGKTRAFQDIGAKPYEYPLPGCEQFFKNNDPYNQSNEYIECKLRHLSGSELHVSGSCKIGSRDDSSTVVDPRLRVHGVKSLRVADASIMPQTITGNPMIPVIMIAEKAASMILEDREWNDVEYANLEIFDTPY